MIAAVNGTARPAGGRVAPLWLLAALPLLPALGVGFLLDDWIGLAQLTESGWSAVAAQLRPMGGQFLRPLGWALFQLDLGLFGLRPVAFHAVHLGLFVLAAWLTGRLAARLGGDDRVAGTAAALALLYPGRTESYAWLATVFDLLALVFVLALLLFHLRWRAEARPGRLVGLAALAFVAPLAKESAYAALPWILTWELVPGLAEPAPRRGRWATGAAVAGGFGLAAVYRLWALGGVGGYAGTSAGGTASRLGALPETVLRAAFDPVNPRYGLASTVLRVACAVALAAVLVAATAQARRQPEARRLLLAGLGLALAGLLPALPYLEPSARWTTSRYFTLFGAGLAIAAAALRGRSRAAGAAIAGLIVAWTAATALNLRPWIAAAGARDAILRGVGEDTRSAGRHRVWIDGPINEIDGAHLLGGALEAAVQVSFPDREIEAGSAFFQKYQRRPVGPPPDEPGVELHRYRFDPKAGRLEPLP